MNEISEGTDVVLKTRGEGELLASEIRNEGMTGGKRDELLKSLAR